MQLQPLDLMFSPPVVAATTNRTWTAIPAFLKAEVDAGESSSARSKARTASGSLLRARKLTPEHAYINLDWFDKTFALDGWDESMPIQRETWADNIYRVRPVIERMTGASAATKELRARDDDWSEAGAHLGGLEVFKSFSGSKRLIPFCSTLTMAARRAGLGTREIDQDKLQALHDEAVSNDKRSLRSVSELIAELQSTTAAIWTWFPHAIAPIEAAGAFHYQVPSQLAAEVEHFVELASRKRYIRVKKKHEYVELGTRINYRTTLHATVGGLIAVGRLRQDANGFASVLEDPDALDDLVNHTLERIEAGKITARSATSLIGRLPVILDRNGIDSSHLRKAIAEVDELRQHPDKVGMPLSTRRFCSKLIENRAYRNKFLLAHDKPRQVAQELLDAAEAAGRPLTSDERSIVIRHGVVATFCSMEVGGAPIRVENYLEMPYGADGAWMWHKGKGIEVNIPGAYTKNKEAIEFEMQPDQYKWCDTVAWFLVHIRPLMLTDVKTGETLSSPWLVPMLSDASRPCPYETFHLWFVKIMRDVVKVPCLPHNFRHGQASLLYHRFPDRIGWIARRLGDTEATVVTHYAWVHNKKVMAEGQKLVVELIES